MGSGISWLRKMKQNVTLSLDKEVLRKCRILAARKDTFISRLLADSIERAVKEIIPKSV
jgi:hypothetical protein